MIIESRKVCCLLPFMCLFYLFFSLTCSITDTLSPSQMIKDGETLTSKGETVELGFFSPGNSRNRYIGVWYKKALPDKKVVWVANRENPILDSSGVLTVHSSGNLVLLDGQQTTLWSTNAPRASANSIVVLLDTGNLVLSEKNSTQSGYLWQSFEHPSHTFLQGMKLRVNSKANGTHFIASWKSENDPSPGRFIAGFYDTQIPQLIVWNGSVRYWRSGPWNGNRFVGIPEMDSNYIDGFRYNPNINEGPYISFFIFNDSYVLMPILDSSGSLKQMLLPEKEKRWTETWKAPKDECEIYGKCGSFGSCSISKTPMCKCLRGFEPKVAEEWNKGNWTNGCMRRTQLQCNKNSSNQGENDGFIKLERTKLPDFSYYLNLNNQECKDECSRNCSCMAYSFADRIGCFVWGDYLIDVQEFSFGGEELYLRLAHSELDKEKKNRVLLVVLPIVGAIIFSALTIFIICWLKLNQRRKKKESVELVDKGKTIKMVKDSPKANLLNDGVRQMESPDLPLFDFRTIALATNNFSVANKLGQGGFGPVYKGRVQDGHEIAVKRLSRSSGQGLEEFMNEVKLISKLQHRNLVRLLGCCIEGEEKLLLYEYMPNRSLDAILFDATRRKLLDWSKRIHIVDGIARGLLYLHRDSRLRVIHRDLKASNILLDVDMNPKISDFGMARIFGGEQTIANTNRVVGTYGYMSPEYAMEGIFSEKSDVFSFGVLLLEIVSSKRCAGFYQSEQSLGFLGYAWKLWNEGKALELIDKTLVDSYSLQEFIRCIHVGLLCVQEHAVDRPSMSTILFMLGSETNLPMPKQPGFTLDRRYRNHDLSFDDNNGIVSVNSVTITSLNGR